MKRSGSPRRLPGLPGDRRSRRLQLRRRAARRRLHDDPQHRVEPLRRSWGPARADDQQREQREWWCCASSLAPARSIQPVRFVENATGTTVFEFDYNEFVDVVDIPPGHSLVYRVRLDDRPKSDFVTAGASGVGRCTATFFHAGLRHDHGAPGRAAVAPGRCRRSGSSFS